MSTFTDKSNFSLKEVIVAIGIAFTFGGVVFRIESRTDTIESKIDNMMMILSQKEEKYENRFIALENRVTLNTEDIRAVTTSVTAFLKPDDISIKKRR